MAAFIEIQTKDLKDLQSMSEKEKTGLLIKQCDRQIDLAKVTLSHSANDIGKFINNFTLQVWMNTKQSLESELNKENCDSCG